jgi:DNA adenine methylase
MLSNSWEDSILELYKDFTCVDVKASRVINSNSEKRGKISELVVINYAS